MSTFFGFRSGSLLRSRLDSPARSRKRCSFRLSGFESLEQRQLLSIAAGDFNGDGFEDAATGLPEQNAVEVAYGTDVGTGRLETWTQDSPKIRETLEAGDEFGASLAAGDFNGDGFDDLAIGAPGEDLKKRIDVGIVHVLYGSEDGLTRRHNSIWFQNKSGIEGQGEDGDMFGASLQTGDFNGDGFDDLSIGVPGDDTLNRLFGSKRGINKRGDELVPNGGEEASLSIQDASVVEGDDGTVNALFTVARSGSLDGTATVDFATAGDTAEKGVDYLAATGQLTFDPNVTSRTVTVEVNGDTADESNEIFFVNLLNAVGANVADSQGRGTIVDDDGFTPPVEPTLSVGDMQVTEGNSGTVNALFHVQLSAAATVPVTVDFATANGTAIEEDDYNAESGQLTFDANATALDVTVAVIGDTEAESNETFFLNLSNASGATIQDAQARATIANDDGQPPPPPTGSLFHVQATVQTESSGGSADDPAIWIHPTDPNRSLIIATNKSSLRVYDIAGNEVQALNDGDMNNVDLRYNFPLGGQSVALVVASNRSNDTMAFYKVNPTSLRLESVGSIEAGISVYGIGMYHSAETGKFYAFVNSKSGVVEQWEVFDGGNGQIDGTLVRTFDVGSQPEGVVADDQLGFVYVGEENVALWKYGAEPNDGSTRTQVDSAGGGRLTADIEGLAIYYKSDGTGYLLVSSQGSNRFAIYAREGNNAYLGSFDIVAGNGIDAVSSTDGIDVTNFPVGDAFPQGFFIAQDNDVNFKMVPWPSIAAGPNPDLAIDTTFDPRGDGGSPPPPPPPPPPPAPTLSVGDVQVTEGNAGDVNAVFTVRLSAAANAAVTAQYATAVGTAAVNSDFATASGTLTIDAGQTQTTVTVKVHGDTSDESNETFFLNLTNASNATLSDSQGQATIVDDDGAPPPPPPPPLPGEGNTFAVIGDFGSAGSNEAHVADLVKSWNPDFVITVGDDNYPAGSASTIDANIGQYYREFIGNYQGTFGSGSAENRFFPALGNHDWQASGARPYLDYFTLPGNERYYDFVQGPVHFFAVDSDGHEPDGNSATSRQGQWLQAALDASTSQFNVVYFHHAAYSSGAHGSAGVMQWPFKQWGADVVLTGHDHDYERLTVDGLRYYVAGTGGRSLRSIGSPVPGSEFRYDDDFGAMLVTANADSLTFQFYSVAGGGTLIDQSVVTADGSPPAPPPPPPPSPVLPSISIGDVQVTEAASGTVSAVFLLTLSSAADQPVTVDIATADGTALAGEDYVASNGQLTFAANVTSRSVTVAVNSDTVDEPNETFFLNLSNAVGATIADGQGRATILDHEQPPPPPTPSGDKLPALTPWWGDDLQPGYVPIEIEAWWAPSTDPHGGWGHIHVAYLERVGQLVTGDDSDGDPSNYVRDFRVTFHNNPSTWNVFRLDLAPGDTIFKQTISPAIQGPADGTQSYYVHVSIPDSQMGNGRQTLRWRATADTPDGKVFTTSSDIQVVTGNGSGGNGHGAVLGMGPSAAMFKGWYTGADYGQVLVNPIPTAPVSGSFSFDVRGREGAERLIVQLDQMHAIPAVGPFLAQSASTGPTLLDTTSNPESIHTVTVDTTKLEDGWHQISVRNFTGRGNTTPGDPSGGTQTNILQGKGNFWFYVDN